MDKAYVLLAIIAVASNRVATFIYELKAKLLLFFAKYLVCQWGF